MQVYVKSLTSREPQPLKALKGFRRVTIGKGATRPVSITLRASDLRWYDEKNDRYVVEPGRYEVQVGASSQDIRAKAVLEVR